MSRARLTFFLMGAALFVLAFIYFGRSDGPAIAKQVPKAASEPRLSAREKLPPIRSLTKSADQPKPNDQPPLPQEPPFEQPATEEDYWNELESLKKSDKKRALAYALQGEDWYSEQGKPAEARRAMIVTLLVDLGRMEEARDRTRSFIELYPNSPYRRLVQGVTGIHPRPGAPPGHQY